MVFRGGVDVFSVSGVDGDGGHGTPRWSLVSLGSVWGFQFEKARRPFCLSVGLLFSLSLEGVGSFDSICLAPFTKTCISF